MRTFLAVLSLLAAVTVTTASQCNWGPAYWCRSETTATQCGQLRYCQLNVWNTETAIQKEADSPRLKSVQCDVCKLVVKFLDEELDKNTTEADAKKALEDLCNDLGSLKDECDTILNEYFDLIWQLLVQELSPTEVCEQIDLCKSFTTGKINKISQSVTGSSIECEICGFIMDEIDQYISNSSTEEEVKQKVLDDICTKLSIFEADCKSFVEDYFDEIWDLLEEGLTGKAVCTELGFCSSSDGGLQLPTASVCDYCKDLDEFIQNYVDNNTTEEDVKEYLEEVCQILVTFIEDFEQPCKYLIDNFDDYWKFLRSEVDNDEFCYQIGACTKIKAQSEIRTKSPPTMQQTPCDYCELVATFIAAYVDDSTDEEDIENGLKYICSLLPSEYSSECTDFVSEYFPAIWDLVKSEVDNDEICYQLKLCTKQTKMQSEIRTKVPSKIQQTACDECKFIVAFLDTFVDSSTTEGEVKMALEELCKFLGNMSSTCSMYVEEYFPLVWAILKQELDNDEICIQLDLCNETSILAEIRTKTPKIDQTPCEECELVVGIVSLLANTNASEADAKEFLKDTCNLLKKFVQDINCDSLVGDYFPLVWAVLKTEIKDDLVCDQLKLCDSAQKPMELLARKKVSAVSVVKGDLECEFCKDLVKILRPLVDLNVTEEGLKKFLEILCDILPKEYKDECEPFLKIDFDLFYKILKQEMDDGELCALLEICNSTSAAFPRQQVGVQKPKVKKPELLCSLCELLIGELIKEIPENATEDDVKKLLDEVCDHIPSELKQYKNECLALVNTYGDEIVKAVLNGLGAKAVCTLVGVCAVVETNKRPIGTTTTTMSKLKLTDCAVCEFVVGFLQDLVKANMTEKEIEDLLHFVCSKFPVAIRGECTAFINEYEQEVIQLVVQGIEGLKPLEICQKIDICPKSSVSMTTLWKQLAKSVRRV